MDFCSFAPHTNTHFSTDRTIHDVTPAAKLCQVLSLPPPFQRHISLSSDCTDLPAHTVTCVSLSPTRVFTLDLVVTYCGHFLLRYSHGTLFCNLLNALRHLRPLTCVCSCVSQPPRGYNFQTFRSSL
jgi:hypothetical protein